jgi:hypothetical protein
MLPGAARLPGPSVRVMSRMHKEGLPQLTSMRGRAGNPSWPCAGSTSAGAREMRKRTMRGTQAFKRTPGCQFVGPSSCSHDEPGFVEECAALAGLKSHSIYSCNIPKK